jgi:chromosome segregation ATPase
LRLLFSENDIAKLRDRTEKVKEELKDAQIVRKNRQEYDALAKQINTQPSREETTNTLEKLELEIKELHEQQKELESKLQEKRKNMHSLTALLNEMDATEEEGRLMLCYQINDSFSRTFSSTIS